MSKYEAELRRRLASDEDIAEVGNWYLQVCIADKLEWKDCSVFEVRFMKLIHYHWQKWMKNRRLN
jgi:hypothetical protein